ncbi:MaoC/PaaZ C-terminal domain-containing protein [Paraburkholderia sp. HP33-1]|uniref:MaoC/PaaZ C-terminal domain-containing protein n=1 Tax=Paraburkholderia sp. HP33-1 TaxID=2883243 RepID=UPI001F16466A|nr:MaoC/PaaZ C-terminal domain-containing protein [Paraburkholderia sp. HP33-1]
MSESGHAYWRVGAEAPTRRVGPVTRSHIVRYAGAGGDFNPVHHDETFAQAAGYPSVFAHGMLTAGILGGYVADWLGDDRLRKYCVRYVAQVWPGDELILSGQVASVQGTASGLIVDCQLAVHRQVEAGEPQLVLSGTAQAVVHDAQED